MRIPVKKLKNGFGMPVYGLGTWAMGGKGEPDPTTDKRDIHAIKTGIKLGVAHIDTAESYATGPHPSWT